MVDEDAITGEFAVATVATSDHATEQAFLARLREAPDDVEARLVYGDWLEERGEHGKAATLRWFAQPRSPSERMTTYHVEHAWLALVSRVAIHGCRMAGPSPCPGQWTALEPTADDCMRRCGTCQREVRFCATLRDVREGSEADQAVAFSATLERRMALRVFAEGQGDWAWRTVTE